MLLLVGISVLASVVAGTLAGGRLRHLADVRFSAVPLAVSSLGIMVALRFDPLGPPLDRAAIATAYVLAGSFLVVNIARHRGALRVGLAILALGWGLNAAVISANGGMPLSLAAHYASGEFAPPTPGEGGFFKIVVAGEGTALRPLGDVIPLRPLRKVASPGDLVLMVGMAAVVAAGMRPPSGLRRRLALPAARVGCGPRVL